MTEKTVNTFCSPHCCETCCEFVATVKDGRAVSLKPHPKMRYSPCPTGLANLQRLYHPDRLKYPLERVGERGEGKWRRISWEEALDKIATKLNEIKSGFGNEAVLFYDYMGQLGVPDGRRSDNFTILRLLNLWGGCIPAYKRGSLCWQALIAAQNALYGSWKVALPGDSECQNIIIWGTNPAETARKSLMRSFKAAKKRGTRFTVIDPVFTETAAQLADTYIPVRPGTDLALALAVMNVIITEGRYYAEYVKEHTNATFLVNMYSGKFLRWGDIAEGDASEYVVWDSHTGSTKPYNQEGLTPALSGTYQIDGVQYQPAWQRLVEHVSEWTPQRAEDITDVPAAQIIDLARALSADNVAKIVYYGSAGMQRASWGENTIYALALLNVITGRLRGGFSQLIKRAASVDIGFDEAAKGFLVENPVEKRIPINHLAEAILNPDRYGTDIKALLVMWGNPVNQNANSNKTIEALKNDSLELIVVCDIFMTATARYADIVLPVSTFLERTSIFEGSEIGHFYYLNLLDLPPKRQLFFREKVVEPLGESKDDFEIVCLLAEKLGYGEYFPWNNAEEWIAEVLEKARGDSRFPWLESITMERLKKEGIIDIDAPAPEPTWDLETPSGRVELYNEELLEQGFDPLPVYRAPEEGAITTPELYHRYPLNLISPHSKSRVHSSFANQPELMKRFPHEVLMHPADAQSRGIVNGDEVSVYNDRGQLRIKARVSDGIRPGVVRIYEGGWPEHGMVNLLTSDRLTTYGENPTYNTCLVEVVRVKSKDAA